MSDRPTFKQTFQTLTIPAIDQPEEGWLGGHVYRDTKDNSYWAVYYRWV
jgi:hypothetical protein